MDQSNEPEFFLTSNPSMPIFYFYKSTHLRLKDHIRLRKAWISQVYHSRHDGSSKGVAILINKKVQFTPTEIITDPYGRFVIISGCLYQTNVLLVNVYAPNWDDTVC